MPIRTIQPSFAGGEFSPSLYARVDLQKYQIGLKTCKNFIIHPHGGASNRPGTRFVAEVKDSTKKTRIIPFEFSTTQAYVIEFGEYYCRFFRDGAAVTPSVSAYNAGTTYDIDDFCTYSGNTYHSLQGSNTGNTPDSSPAYWEVLDVYQITTPYAEDDLFELKFTQSADTLYLVHSDYEPKLLVRYGDADWELEDFPFENGPFMLSNTTESHTLYVSATTGSGVTMTASSATFDTSSPSLHIDSLWRLTHKIDGQAHQETFTATGAASSSIKCKGTWRLKTSGTWTGKFKIEKSYDGGSNWVTIQTFSSEDDVNYAIYGSEDDYCLIRCNVTAYTSGNINTDLSVDTFYVDGIAQITAVSSSTVATVTILDEVGLAGSGNTTDDWAEGSWSDYRGWPSAVTFYQDRLVFSGTDSEPQTVWMSKTGAYTDFGISDPLVDDDHISVNLPSRKLNGIQNLVTLGNVLALTSASEWSIGPGSTGIISPTSVESRCQGYRGSSNAGPIVIGNRAIYVQPMGSVIRDIGYDYAADGYVGDEISIYANHFFDLYTIVEIAYQQEPDSIAWFIRNDGALISCTYLREQEVLAWAQHDTEGYFESVCCIPGDGFDEVWFVVRRGSDRFIERMVNRGESTDPKHQWFVDSGLDWNDPKTISGATQAVECTITCTAHGFSNGNYVDITEVTGMTELNGNRYLVSDVATNSFKIKDSDSGDYIDSSGYTAYSSGGYARKAVTTLSGLDHLEGQTLKVLGDGVVLDDALVSSGQITISTRSGIVVAGLGYTSDLQTLTPELSLNDGTMQSRKIKINEVSVHFLNSAGGKLGPDADNLDDLDLDADADAAYSGKYNVTIGSQYNYDPSVFYRQDEPLPVTILSIIPKVSPGG